MNNNFCRDVKLFREFLATNMDYQRMVLYPIVNNYKTYTPAERRAIMESENLEVTARDLGRTHRAVLQFRQRYKYQS